MKLRQPRALTFAAVNLITNVIAVESLALDRTEARRNMRHRYPDGWRDAYRNGWRIRRVVLRALAN